MWPHFAEKISQAKFGHMDEKRNVAEPSGMRDRRKARTLEVGCGGKKNDAFE